MSGARHKLENSAMFATEREIVDLFDGGASVDAIAGRLNKNPSYVRVIVNRFTVTGDQPFDRMVKQGTAALLAAIRRHHPEKIQETI